MYYHAQAGHNDYQTNPYEYQIGALQLIGISQVNAKQLFNRTMNA